MHIVGHTAKDCQIRFVKPDRFRFLAQVLAAPGRSILQVDAVERDTSDPDRSTNRMEHALFNVKNVSSTLLYVGLDSILQPALVSQRLADKRTDEVRGEIRY
jgi:hypothetical protein